MKKSIIGLSILGILFATNTVLADGFDNVSNLTVAQQQRLQQIQMNYKQEYNSLETRIMSYKDKLSQLQTSNEKNAQEKELIKASYERNIATLQNQQDLLKQNTESMYQKIMTPSQFQQYSLQQTKTEQAFADFLKGAK